MCFISITVNNLYTKLNLQLYAAYFVFEAKETLQFDEQFC